MIRFALLAALALGCLPNPTHSVTLTPATPEVETALLAADARWEAAGVDPNRIIIGPGGAPVTFDPTMGPAAITTQIYEADVFVGVRRIELNMLTADVVAHEMGHAMGALDAENMQDTGPCVRDAATRPVMCEHTGNAIVADDLAQVCSDGGCGAFKPEGE